MLVSPLDIFVTVIREHHNIYMSNFINNLVYIKNGDND